MKVKLSENIKRFRKARKMTQEQLAEAMGVSVSAVYKWESNQSTPEIGLILEMADLFRTSTDVLLGFEWQTGGASSALEKIAALAKAKAYDEALAEAEKALKNYPNHFDVVYRSAEVYLEAGAQTGRREATRRAIPLLEHACGLIDRNREDGLSEISIRTQIAKAYLLLGQAETALRILKKNNVCGVNNARIGMVLSDFLHDADGAERYLGRAFASFTEEIDDIMIGFANVFFQRGNYRAAADCLEWLRVVLRGIQPEEKLTAFDRYDCILLETVAECCCFLGEPETARQYLARAAEKAARFDGAADGEISDMAFFAELGLERPPTYGEPGKTAMEGLRDRIEMESAAVPGLGKLWAEVAEEAFPDETV